MTRRLYPDSSPGNGPASPGSEAEEATTEAELEAAKAALEAATTEAETAAAAARAASEKAKAETATLEEERLRRSRLVQAIVGFTAPPIVGLAILVVTFAGAASDAVAESPAATSTALIVGAALMLVPPILFAVSHERYAQHQAGIERRLLALISPSEASNTELLESRDQNR
jgi:hypothetical protein